MFALLTGLGFSRPVEAQTDSLHLSLEEATVTSLKNNSVIRHSSEGMMKVDMKLMQNLPQILGNTDPLRFVRLLPGVQTNSDCDSGIHIQGCDNAHNEVSIGGIPVYGATHLLGLFSIFNPSHYGNMTFSNSSSSNRLGGLVNVELPDTLKEKVSGDVSVGMASSQGTIGLRLGEKSHLKLSARSSYLNLFYKKWMKIDHGQLDYGFSDYNFTYTYAPTGKDKLWADFYYGRDLAGLYEMSYNMDFSMGWDNLLGALHWKHTGNELWHKHSLFYSGYTSDLSLIQDGNKAKLPSSIMSGGYKGKAGWRAFTADADVTLYQTQLQHPSVSGLFGSSEGEQGEQQRALESSLGFEYGKTFANGIEVSARLRGSLYYSPESRFYYGLCPNLSLSYDMFHKGKLKASYGWKKQYLFQTGLSNIGFPLEFWVMSGKYSDPQKCQYMDAAYEVDLFNDMLSVAAGVYWKRLYNQTEYNGDILDMLMSRYDLADKILKGKGWNYGFNVMVHKQAGDFTGWINYSWGRSLRTFDNPAYDGVFPSNHERIHDLHVAGSYMLGSWTFSATYVLASGLPFTAPETFHLSSGQILVDFGRHNAHRMRPYMRMDASVTYHFKKDSRYENGINLSVYNTLSRKNELGYRLFIKDDGYHFGPIYMPFKLMPSLGYFHKF